MENQKKQGYFSVFFKQWHFVTALLFASILITLLLADIEYGLLSSLFTGNSAAFLSFALIAAIIVFALAITLIFDAGRPSINFADAFGWAFLLTAIVYTAILCALKRITLVRTLFAAVMLIFGLILTVRCLKAFGKKDENDGIVAKKKGIVGYYSAVFGKYSFLTVIALFAFVVIAVYSFVISKKNGAADYVSAPVFNIFSIVCLAVTAIYFLFGLFDKKIRFFDVCLTSLLFSAPVIAAETAIAQLPEADGNFWLIVAAVLFGIAVIGTIIRSIRFDPIATFDTNKKKGYFSQISAKFTLLAPFAAACALFFITFIAFRFGQIKNFYWDYIVGNTPDTDMIAAPYLFVLVSSLFALLLSGLITLGSFKSDTVCFGDATLIICLAYTVLSLVSFIVISSSIIPIALMAIVAVYVLAILGVRVARVRKFAKAAKAE